MADFFTEVKAIVLSTTTKAEKIHKLVNDLKCTPHEAERFYTIIQCVEGKPERGANTPPQYRRRRFTVGVEIECFGIDKNAVREALAAKGVKSIATGYNHDDSEDTYKLGADSSINGTNSCEVVSPVLRSLATLQLVCETINELGAQVNKSCGLHVHFGADKFTLTDWVRIIINYANIEPIIDSFMAESRRGSNNCYCESIIRRVVGLRNMTVCEFDTIREAFGYDRYYKVNVEAYCSHKTIEFRQHQGTTDFRKIEKWVGFLGGLINWSIDHEEPIQAACIDELPFLNATQKRYFNKRKQLLNA